MPSPPAVAEEPVRERAFLALLLLVGAGAVAVGLYQVYRTNASSISAVLDLSLGASVLLVSWIFLAPSALPDFFGDPRPGERPVTRPYLPPVAAPTAPKRTPSHAHPEHVIPKWADPLVAPRAGPSPRTFHGGSTAAPGPIAVARLPEPQPIPRPERPAPRVAEARAVRPPEPFPRTEPLAARVEIDERPPPEPPRWSDRRIEPRAPHSNEMLLELDRIEAELRAFEPLETSSGPAAAAGIPTGEGRGAV